MFTLFRRPIVVHVTAHDFRIDVEKRLADILREGEIAIPILVQIVVEYATDAALFVPVGQEKIFVAPF